MRVALLLLLPLLLWACAPKAPAPTPPAESDSTPLQAEVDASVLSQQVLLVDGHVDLPYRWTKSLDSDGRPTEDVSQRTEGGHFDHPRAVAGGLDAPFMSIYVPARLQDTGGAKQHADLLIDWVESLISQHPEAFARAHSVDEVRANFAAGRISLPLGIENGAAIESKLDNLAHFHRRGVRYITLTHSKDNAICDSSYDPSRTWGGLSPFGEAVVAEMNRLGILIDVSHISDSAFDQVMALTEAPVIASHSSARHFTPGFERNLSDEMISTVANNGGVVMINFGSSFLLQSSRDYFDGLRSALQDWMDANGVEDGADPRVREWADAYKAQHPPVFATVDTVADHIDHVVKLAGIAHVGIGSDYDGLGDSLPTGLKDVSQYPTLWAELLERGYSQQDIARIAGENVLRVWRAAEEHAQTP